ncbi:hypothetical protein [Paraburkholderia sp. BCC1885]|jgi:hypothetical protein|uniref:hypothetical protein n=1 Tax=Paraburkholderia sp. BCC1885 TaxID=2562669 RepID=UPI001182E7CF|nr:hypothetical protein [Paraburkholderia sp. BCC1885]
MKPATINLLRNYLLTASLAASVIDAAALLLIDLFGVSENVFTSTTFRLAAVAAIACFVLLTKCIGRQLAASDS